MPSIVAGIEMGGTGCKVAISDDNGQYDSQFSLQIVTTTADSTLQQLYDWLVSKRSERAFVALGIACFGPIDLDPTSKTYGYITTTPKPGWQYVNVVGAFQGLNVPIAFETDVNAPAMTEAALRGDTSAAYITIGTGKEVNVGSHLCTAIVVQRNDICLGVGVGLVIDSRPIHGLMHPEAAHIKCERCPGDDYPGDCPFHGACIEGMSNAKSAADRLGILPSQLSTIADDHPVWNTQAYYIGQLCAAVIYVTSVKRIVIGGGLTQRTGLFEHIRKHVRQILNSYINLPRIMNDLDNYIVPSLLGDRIGIQSAFDIAQVLAKKD